MTAPLVLTGGSGFVGRRMLRALAAARVPAVRILSRSGAVSLPADAPPDWKIVTGDLLSFAAWPELLGGADTVIHLAARTGKGSREDHLRGNRDTTNALLGAAAAQGVRRFLLVSSIAAGFADQRHYHYGLAKAEAEALVRASGLEALIVRPTMVFGPGSIPLANLRRLALLPVPVVFGPGKRLQPIHVDDLAEELVASLGISPWPAESVDLGGPVVVELVELMAELRRSAGRPPRRPWHLPLGLIRGALAAAEPALGRFLPITAGQLAAFANPSVARPSPFRDRLPSARRGLAEMLAG